MAFCKLRHTLHVYCFHQLESVKRALRYKMETITFYAYDTICSVGAVGGNGEDPQGDNILHKAKDIAKQVEHTLNMYNPSSELSRLCASYHPGVPYMVSPMLYQFIRLNLEFAAMSGGAFDPTVGILMKLWNFLAADPVVPNDAQIEAALQRVGYQHVHTVVGHSEILIDIPGVVLDPGASGKGFALSLVADYLKMAGVQQAMLNFGGNLYALGLRPATEECSARPWRIAIRDPNDLSSYIGTVTLNSRGLATSSWYEHCFFADAKVHHHLIDPRTGRPKEPLWASVSVLSSHAAYTDLASTSFFLLDDAGRKKLTQRLVRNGIDIDYVAVSTNGTISASPGAGFSPKNGV